MMKRTLIFMIALILALSMISCGRISERQVEKMIEEAVEEALEDQADEAKKDDDKGDDKEDEEDIDDDKEDKDDIDDEKHDDIDIEDDDSEEGSVSIGDMTFDYMGEDIPEGFPTDVVPMYESRDAEIIGATKADSEDGTVFSLGIGTDDKPKDVSEYLRDELKDMYKNDEFQEISMGDYSMFIISAKEWAVTLNVVDGEEEGYNTLVAYTVLSN